MKKEVKIIPKITGVEESVGNQKAKPVVYITRCPEIGGACELEPNRK